MDIYPDFREFFALLNARDVRYMVVGGYALGFHGAPRYTGDIDIWVEPASENASRVLAALSDFGFGSLAISEADLTEPDRFVQLGYPPQRIDLLSSPSGVNFADCFESRVTISLGDVDVSVIGLDCLKANKLASGRRKDLADLDNLP